MATVRLRYQNGQFIPLDPVTNLHEGDEVLAEIQEIPDDHAITEMLNRTRGLWADWDGVEEYIEEARAKWDEEWQDRLSSL